MFLKGKRYLKRLSNILLLHAVIFLIAPEFVHAQNVNASFSSDRQSGCSPLTVQFINTSSNATSYLWDFGNGATSVLANPVIVFNNTGSYTVKLIAYGTNGSIDSVANSNYISVNANPVANFTGANLSGCAGTIVSFTNQSAAYDSCVWDFGDGVTSAVQNPSHVYNTSGSYAVTLVVYNTAYGCQASITKPAYVSILPSPVISVTVDTTYTCNASHTFQFAAASPVSATYTWSFGDGTFANGANTNHIYNTSGNYTVTVTAVSTSGCTDTLSISNYIHVLSNPQPVITLSDSIGCAPLVITFAGIASSVNTWQWNFGDATGSAIQNPLHTYSVTGNFNTSLVVTYANGCSNTSAMHSVAINNTPNATFTLSSLQGCKPLNVQFTQQQTSGASFTWDFGDGNSTSSINPSHLYTQQGVFYPALTATSANGCTATYTYPYAIRPGGPQAAFAVDIRNGCTPLTVNFSNQSTNAVQGSWNFGDGTTSSLTNPSHIYTATGNYFTTLIVTDANGCRDTLTDIQAIQVGGSTNGFNSPSTIYGCAPYAVSMYDSSNSSSWLWHFGDGDSATVNNPTHTYTTAGTYVVSLQTQSAGNGCSQYISNFNTYVIGGGEPQFTYQQTICPPYIGYFQDSSLNAVAWLWHFGDGTTSTLQNPVHNYSSPGHYNVTLTITTADGCTSTATHNYAMNFSVLGAAVTAQCNDSVPPYNVQFYANSSGATQWLWTFGDGDSSSLENPMHPYLTPGPFTITLTVSNDTCTYTYTFPPIEIGFGSTDMDSLIDSTNVQPMQSGCPPFTVNFHNPVLNSASWNWNFGDGFTSTLEHPVHTYQQPGLYSVTLYATLPNGNIDTVYTPNAVYVPGPVANFSNVTTNMCNGVSVGFQNLSQNASTFAWDFGDGNTSNAVNPQHTYTSTSSNYVVTLHVTDTIGCTSTISKSLYASSAGNLHTDKNKACAGDTITFTASGLNFASYLWHFGDGTTATGLAAIHAFADSGFYSITLDALDSSGCITTFTLPLTIEINKPVANFISDTVFSNCIWMRLQFTNLSTGADVYQWEFGDSTYSSVQNPTKYWYYNQPPGYYDVKLTAMKNSCSSTLTMDSVIYIPDLKVGFTTNQLPGCMPITVVYTDTSHDVVSWQWFFGDGGSSTLQHPLHTFTTEPMTDVIYQARDINGCVKTITKPNIELMKPGVMLSDTAGCNPLTVIFTDTSQHVVSWFWNFGDGTTDTLSSPSHTYLQNGVFDVSVIIESDYGCIDTLQLDSAVRIYSPLANFSLTGNDGCAPVSVSFADSSVDAADYLWDFGDGSSSVLQNPQHIYTIPGIYNVSLTVTNTGGCSNTKTIQQAVYVLGPVALFGVAVLSGCIPLNIQFIDSSSNAISYNWNFGDGDSSSALIPNHVYTSQGFFQPVLTVTDSIGCQSTYIYPVAISVYNTPAADFSVSDSIICIGTPVSFTNNSTDASGYVWHFGDGNTSTVKSPSHTYTAAGIYSVKLVASNSSCTDSLVKLQLIHVIQKPIAAFIANPVNGCVPLAVTFTNQSQQLQNPVYSWKFGNSVTSAMANPFTIYSLPGTYTVSLKVVNEGLCTDSITKVNYINAQDGTPPPMSPILSASVVSSNSIKVTWQNSAATDLFQYQLFRLNDTTNIFDLVYTDVNPQNSSWNVSSDYTDTTVNTALKPYSYKIQTIDLCGNKITLNNSVAHTTILLTSQPLFEAVALSWSFYEGCSVSGYQIERRDNPSGAFAVIGNVSASENSLTDSTSFCPHSYEYKIIALDLCSNPYVSESNIAQATPQSSLLTQQIEVTRSTVVDNSYILTEWMPPAVHPDKVLNYYIYKGTDTSHFELASVLSSFEYSYNDYDVNVQTTEYFYRVEVENICNVRSIPGNISNSVLLEGELNINNNTNLHWSPYKGWDSGVEKYEIQKLDENGVWKTIRSVDGNTNAVEDE